MRLQVKLSLIYCGACLLTNAYFCLTVFVCHDPPIDGVRYLSVDLGVTCFSGAHLSTAAGAVAVFAGYALGFPVAILVVFRGRVNRCYATGERAWHSWEVFLSFARDIGPYSSHYLPSASPSPCGQRGTPGVAGRGGRR